VQRNHKKVQRTTGQQHRTKKCDIVQRDEKYQTCVIEQRFMTKVQRTTTLSKEEVARWQQAKTNNSVQWLMIVGKESTPCKEPSYVNWQVNFPFHLVKELLKSDLFNWDTLTWSNDNRDNKKGHWFVVQIQEIENLSQQIFKRLRERPNKLSRSMGTMGQ